MTQPLRPIEDQVIKTFGEDADLVTTKQEIICLKVAIKGSLELAILLGVVVYKFGYPGLNEKCSGSGEFPTKCIIPLRTLFQSCIQTYQSSPQDLPEHCEGKIIYKNGDWEFQGFFFGESVRLQLIPDEQLELNVIEIHC